MIFANKAQEQREQHQAELSNTQRVATEVCRLTTLISLFVTCFNDPTFFPLSSLSFSLIMSLIIQALAEKQQQIDGLLAEGRKLSEAQFKSANINKKLQQRTKVTGVVS